MIHPSGSGSKTRAGLGGTKYVLVGVAETLAKLDQLVQRYERAVPALVRSVTEDAAGRARALVRRRSGATSRAIKTAYFDGQWTGAVFVEPVPELDVARWSARTKTRVSRAVARGASYRGENRPSKFPVWLEWGTRRAQPNPFLLPAGEYAFRRMQDELPRLIDRFVKDAE